MLPGVRPAQREEVLDGLADLRSAHGLQILPVLQHAIGCENGCVRVGVTTVIRPGVPGEEIEDVETVLGSHAHQPDPWSIGMTVQTDSISWIRPSRTLKSSTRSRSTRAGPVGHTWP